VSDHGVGAGDEVLIASIAGDKAFFVHTHGFVTNGANQGMYDFSQKKWWHGGRARSGFPCCSGAAENNTQGGGASAAVVVDGLMYKQSWHQITCWESKEGK